jgi:hypothetical protein
MKTAKRSLIFTGLAILFWGCSVDYEYEVFMVKNETDKHLTIEAYLFHDHILDEIITVLPYSNYETRKTLKYKYLPGLFQAGVFIDSVVIKFNNEKYLPYRCNRPIDTTLRDIILCNDKRNIINYEDYYKVTGSDDKKVICVRYYTITEQDYLDAEWY